MRRLQCALLTTVAVIGFTSIASAADMPVKAPAVAPVALYNWTGLYLGLHGGGAWGRTKTENVAPFGGFDEGIFESYSLDTNRFFGGGQIGYNWQRSSFVYGLEAEIGYLGLKEELNLTSVPPDDFISVKFGWYGTLTGRLGVAWNNVLAYAKGGAAVARITNIATDTVGATGAFDPNDYAEIAKTKWGWALGGGLEYGFSPHWSIKGEFLYMDFGKVTSANVFGELYEHRNRVSTAKLGVNYRF